MLEIPSLKILILQAEQDLSIEIDDGLRKGLRQALAYAIAYLTFGLYLSLRFLSKQFFVDTANTAFGLLWASIYGVPAQDPLQSKGDANITGTNIASVTGGEVLQRDDGVQFTVDAPGAPIVAGQATVAVTAVESGTAGNTLPLTALTFLAPPAGIDAPAVVSGTLGDLGLQGGTDAETPESLQARTLEKIRAPNIAGAEQDYVVWATEAGAATAFARGSYAGIGTVLVIITQPWDPAAGFNPPANTPTPAPSLITAVEDFIEIVKPAGLWLVAVQGPVIETLGPFILLSPDTPEIRTSVTNSLALALDEVEPGGTAFYDDLVTSINRAAGEVHHQLWTDDGFGSFGPNNTEIGQISKIIPGTITWTAPP